MFIWTVDRYFIKSFCTGITLSCLYRTAFFNKILQPAIDIYRSFGFEAIFAPPADIQADGRKCSGNGAGDIGPCTAYVGNVIIDFDFETMSKVLKMPVPAFRTHFYEAMKDHMFTLSDRIAHIDKEALEKELIKGFQKQFGELNSRILDDEVTELAVSLKIRLTSKGWLKKRGRRSPLRKIKIAEGIFLQEISKGDHQTVFTLIKDGKVDGVLLREWCRGSSLSLAAA